MKKNSKKKAVRKVKKEKASRPKPAEKPAAIEFCAKCGSILVPIKKNSGNIILKCRKCGSEKKKTTGTLKIKQEVQNKTKVVVLEKDITTLPITEQICEKCSNNKAYWWMQQTREADEPPTQFFRCTKCRHVWREYK